MPKVKKAMAKFESVIIPARDTLRLLKSKLNIVKE